MSLWTEQMRRELSDIEIFPLEVLKILPACEEFDGGIYFLWLNDDLQYIGKSRQICQRLTLQEYANTFDKLRTSHAVKPIPFDRHTCIVVHSGRIIEDRAAFDQKIQRLERAYIAHYMPPFNNLNQNPGT